MKNTAVCGHSHGPRGLRTLFLSLVAAVAVSGTALALALTMTPAQAATTEGVDVPHHQGTINWTSAAGAGTAFADDASSVGTLPAGWATCTFWQYTSTGSVPGVSGGVDRDTFNGSTARLLALANNTA